MISLYMCENQKKLQEIISTVKDASQKENELII